MRPIDADALRKAMFNYYDCVNEHSLKHNYCGDTLMDYEVADLIDDCIDNAPTLDPTQLVPEGEWVFDNYTKRLRCSECETYKPYDVVADTIDYWDCDYCPNCGARMRKENDR